MSPFSIERVGARGKVSYPLTEGPFIVSTKPEVWIEVEDENNAVLEFPLPASGEKPTIERCGTKEVEGKVMAFLKREGSIIYDSGSEEYVIIRWERFSELERMLFNKAYEIEERRYHSLSSRMKEALFFGKEDQKRLKRGGLLKIAEHTRRVSLKLALYPSTPLMHFAETLVFSHFMFFETLTGRREKILKESLKQALEAEKQSS